MSSTIVVRRYAEAYFALARERDAIDEWRTELARAAETVANDEVQRALANPRLSLAERVRLAYQLLDGSSDEVRSLIRLLIERNRSALIGSLLADYDRLADAAAGIVHVEITAAIALDEATRKAVIAAIASQVRGTIKTEIKTDPGIIGGIVIRIDDRVIDDSVRTHLQQLQASLA